MPVVRPVSADMFMQLAVQNHMRDLGEIDVSEGSVLEMEAAYAVVVLQQFMRAASVARQRQDAF